MDYINHLMIWFPEFHLNKASVIALIKSGAIPCKSKREKLIAYLKSQYVPTTFQEVISLPSYKTLGEQ